MGMGDLRCLIGAWLNRADPALKDTVRQPIRMDSRWGNARRLHSISSASALAPESSGWVRPALCGLGRARPGLGNAYLVYASVGKPQHRRSLKAHLG